MRWQRDNDPTWLYRFYSLRGGLLYVGIARDFERRLAQHRATKQWINDAAFAVLEQYATREQALDIERYWIYRYRPIHNTVGKAADPFGSVEAIWPPTPIREDSYILRPGVYASQVVL